MQAVIIFLPDLFRFWLTASMNHSLERLSQPSELKHYLKAAKDTTIKC